MNNGKNVKEKINLDFFELPPNSLKSKFITLKNHMNVMKITVNGGELFVCNKTSEYDKYFVKNALEGDFVFVKDEVIQKIYGFNFSADESIKFFEEVKKLKNLSISIVIFPEQHLTVFGEFKKLSESISNFLIKFEMDIKFINLIGSYFINPVWTNSKTACDTKLEHKFTISLNEQKSLPKDELYDKMNKYMPSSASIYAKKYPIYLRSNRCAEHLEKIIYACPTCKKFLTLYSEFNCVKCKNCGSAFEISYINAEISLTKTFSSLDEAKSFQFNLLKDTNIELNKEILTYHTLNLKSSLKNEKDIMQNVELSVFQNKLIYKIENESTTIPFDMIYDIYLSQQNTLVIEIYDLNLQDNYKLYFTTKNRENFYIIIDLYQIYILKS